MLSKRNGNTHSRRSAARSLTPQLSYENLEAKMLLAAVFPTAHEQYVLELVNRARANPAAYAASLGINLNEGLPAGTISTAAKQPLAINPFITDAARKHSQWMLDTNKFQHAGPGNNQPKQRMINAGYVFRPVNSIASENIGFKGTTKTITSSDITAYVKGMQENLFIDKNVAGRGHRQALMDSRFSEVGVGVRSGKFTTGGTTYNAVMLTQKFAQNRQAYFLTGVVYRDNVVVNNFYNVGEGLGNVNIRAINDHTGATYTTKTWASGGYSLELPPGRYSVMASGGQLGASQFLPAVVVNDKNVKRDFKHGVVRQAPEIAVFGNSQHISKSATPIVSNNTHFGSANTNGQWVKKGFYVRNLGNQTLVLGNGGMPRVDIVGTHASDFVITKMPNINIGGSSFSTFDVQFKPSATGNRNAVVRIWSNDADERPFRINIRGVGVNPNSPSDNGPSMVGDQWVTGIYVQSTLPDTPTPTVSVDHHALAVAHQSASDRLEDSSLASANSWQSSIEENRQPSFEFSQNCQVNSTLEILSITHQLDQVFSQF